MNTRIKILISILVALVVMVNHLDFTDKAGLQYVESGLKRALVTYAVARGLNGVISVAQGTEVAVEPAGIGLTFTPGQILDPVNDLIERFSWVVLVSGTSLGIQELLLNISSWFWFKAIVTATVVSGITMVWFSGPRITWITSLLVRLSIVVVVLRFTVPLISVSNEIIYRNFLEPRYTASSEQLQNTTLSLEEINNNTRDQAAVDTADEGILENAKRIYRSAVDRVNMEARIERFREAAENISEHTINLIVIFVTQTLLLPLFFLWLIFQVIKWAILKDFSHPVNDR